MRIAKRLLTLFMVIVMAMTAFSVTVSAGIEDTAKSISSGKAVSTTLYSIWDIADYKINVTSNGTLKIALTSEMNYCNIYVYDVYGNKVRVANESVSAGGYSYSQIGYSDYKAKWNSVTEKYIGTISYGVSKGTYYIRFARNGGSGGNGKINFTATFPSSSSSTSTGKVSYLTLTMSKGWSLQLGAVVSPTGKKVTWKSSKKSVVSVSSSGLITAKKKGTAIITAKCGSSTKKITIIVK